MVMRSLVAAVITLVLLCQACSGGDEPIEFDYPITNYTYLPQTSTVQERDDMVGSTQDLEADLQACEEFAGASPDEVRHEFYYLDPEECP